MNFIDIYNNLINVLLFKYLIDFAKWSFTLPAISKIREIKEISKNARFVMILVVFFLIDLNLATFGLLAFCLVYVLVSLIALIMFIIYLIRR